MGQYPFPFRLFVTRKPGWSSVSGCPRSGGEVRRRIAGATRPSRGRCMTTTHSLRSATLLVAALLAACSSRDPSVPSGGASGGTLVISVAADADEFLTPLTVNVTSVQVDG